MRILITGVRGFIGASLARLAVGLGHEVVGVARAGGRGADPGCRIVSVEGERALSALIDDLSPTAIVHAAGKASVGASMIDPREDFEGAVLTWIELLEAVRRSTRRPALVLPSSAAVYGNPASLPVNEGAPTRPISPYGFHKLAAELLAEEYASCFGLEITVLRLFSVFGPAQRRLLVWELFDQLAGPAEHAIVQGTGRETRDFLHVDDVGEAMLRILDRPRAASSSGHAEIVNLGSGEEISVFELAEIVKGLVGTSKDIICRGIERPGDPRQWRADVSRLDKILAPWRPRSARAALPACIAAWKAHSA